MEPVKQTIYDELTQNMKNAGRVSDRIIIQEYCYR